MTYEIHFHVYSLTLKKYYKSNNQNDSYDVYTVFENTLVFLIDLKSSYMNSEITGLRASFLCLGR